MRVAEARRACVLLVGLLVCAAGAARADGFPRQTPDEKVLVGPGRDAPVEADVLGHWNRAPERVSSAVKKATFAQHWLARETVADGFVRARLEAGRRGVEAALLLRGDDHGGDKPGRLSGYAVDVRGRRVRLQRWDEGLRRPLVATQRIERTRSLEITAWMVGPQLNVIVHDGETLRPVASFTATDPKYPGGRVGVVVAGSRAGQQALTLLTVRAAGGEQGAGVDAPVGEHRYLALSKAAFEGLAGPLAGAVEPMEARDGEVIVRTDAAGHERLARAGVPHRWLSMDTPFKYEHRDYLQFRDQPVERTARGFRIDRCYKNPKMVEAILEAYAKRFPKITRLVRLGHSAGGRPILALKISDHPERDEDEPAVFLNGSHHGDELLALEFALDAVQGLVEGYATDGAVRRWVDGLETWVVPLVNPDGNWVFLEHSTYAGRKNQRDVNGTGRWEPYDGVDLNRNYPFRWGALGEKGSRSNRRSEWYRGPKPASERETRALMRLTDSEHFAASISYHTVSNVILAPYTTNRVQNPLNNEAWQVALDISRQVPKQPTGRKMGVAKQIYPVDGVDQDHFRATHGTVALLVEGALHNPKKDRLRRATVRSTRPTWRALARRVLDGPRLSGRVTDPQGRPVSAEVVIAELAPQMGEVWTTRCRDGRFDRLPPKPGTYTIEVKAPGYLTHRQSVRVAKRGPTRLNVTLTPGGNGAPTAKLCGDPALLSIDQACACEVGECSRPGPPLWCRIDGKCVRAGQPRADGLALCRPEKDQSAWTPLRP